MAKKVETVVEKEMNGQEEHKPILEAARKVLLAGIGAVALAQDEIEDFVNRLVERGEIAEKDGRKLLNEVMDRRKKDADKAEDVVTKRVEEILDRMNVPTKADIEALSDKITLLSKVDELKRPRSPANDMNTGWV
jgi:poly(hydroxyalkanoate) granule-associated protein